MDRILKSKSDESQALLFFTGAISLARILAGAKIPTNAKSADDFWKDSKHLSRTVIKELKKVENESEDS